MALAHRWVGFDWGLTTDVQDAVAGSDTDKGGIGDTATVVLRQRCNRERLSKVPATSACDTF